jgi:hypothetical protein
MADPIKRLRHQIERKESREHYRRLLEDQLVDITYRGYFEDSLRNKHIKP